MFRDGTDEWVTGETLDAAIKCNEMEIYTALEKSNAAMENWSPALLTTQKGYGLYCAKHVGPTCTSDGTITPTLKGLPLQQDPFVLPVNSSKATPTPPFDSLLRAALVSPSLGVTPCVAAPGDTEVKKATPGDTEPESTLNRIG